MFHIIEETGDPGKCSATIKCPYGDLVTDHYETEEAAREAVEAKYSNSTFSTISSRISHEVEFSDQTLEVLGKLSKTGLTPYVVGGSVRDSLLNGAVPKDIDIEVFGIDSTDALEKVLRKNGYKVDSVGNSFGVLKVVLENGEDLDISLPRRDSKMGTGHRGINVEVDPTLTLEDAAGRRDYTINALYYDYQKKEIIDSFYGYADYKRGLLRHINESFADDPLRVVRGAQFAARFKMEIAPETIELAKRLKPEASTISTERYQEEFKKLFSKGDISYGFNALKAVGWDEELDLATVDKQTILNSQKAVDEAKRNQEDPSIAGAAEILSKVPIEVRRRAASRMLIGNRAQSKAMNLAALERPKSTSSKDIKAWARAIGKKGLTAKMASSILRDPTIEKIAKANNSWEQPIPDIVTGEFVLKSTSMKPGPWLGKLNQAAARAQDNEEFTDAQGARIWVENYLQKLD